MDTFIHHKLWVHMFLFVCLFVALIEKLLKLPYTLQMMVSTHVLTVLI